MYRGVGTVGHDRVDHVLDARRKGNGQYFWRKALVRCYMLAALSYADIKHPYRKIRDVVGTIYEAVLHLPKPIRRVCIVSLSPIPSFQRPLKPKIASGAERYKSPHSWDGSRTFSTLPLTSPKSWPKNYIINLISIEPPELVAWPF